MVPVELGKQVEFPLLLRFGNAPRRIEVRKRFCSWAQAYSLVKRGHEAGTPIARATDYLRIVVTKNGKRRQVLVLRAKPVTNPRAEGWSATQGGARVHLADAIG